jgi:ribonuclease HI
MKGTGIVIHTDGGSRGNPGPAACAFVAEAVGKTLQKESSFLGPSTNNYAEYQGVLLALKWLKENYKDIPEESATFYLDSELVVRQLNGLYKVKDKKLIELFSQIGEVSKTINIKIFYKNIPRAENEVADFLLNQELDRNS